MIKCRVKLDSFILPFLCALHQFLEAKSIHVTLFDLHAVESRSDHHEERPKSSAKGKRAPTSHCVQSSQRRLADERLREA